MSRRKNRFELISKHPAISAGLAFVVVTATAGVVLTTVSSVRSSDPAALGQTSLTSEQSRTTKDPGAPVTSAAASASATAGAHASTHSAHAAAKPATKTARTATKAAGATDTSMAGMTMAGMTMAAPKPGKWISVNAAQQKRDTAAFFAMKPARITNNPVTVPEFNAQCTTSHRGKNDPIVFPGQTGASHDHTFFGNDSTNAKTTLASLLKKTASSCKPDGDHSSYWVPTLQVNGKAVVPNSVTVYYGSSLSNHAKVQPFPQGLRMIVGDPRNQVQGGSDVHSEFYCQGEPHVLTKSGFPTCTKTKTGEMNFDLVFPECWDGKHLDSPDHKAHMAVGGPGGKCPATHPVQVPSLHFVIHYPRGFDPAKARLSSGNAFSVHGDFFNAWEKPALAKRVRNCINQSVKCSTAGTF